jgi:hypothetical protein
VSVSATTITLSDPVQPASNKPINREAIRMCHILTQDHCPANTVYLSARAQASLLQLLTSSACRVCYPYPTQLFQPGKITSIELR